MLAAHVDIGLGSAWIHAVGVDAHGAVLAEATTGVGSHPKQEAFVWRNGTVRALRYGQSSWVDGTAINGRGDVVGDSRGEAVLWRDGKPTALGAFEPSALNDSDVVVGDGNVGGQIHGFVWRDGTLTDIGTLGGGESHAWVVNARGQVAGTAAVPGGAMHAVLWQDGTTTDLGTLPGLETSVHAIDDAGTVVGFASDHVGDGRIAVEWQGGRLVELGTFGAPAAEAVAIDRRGDVLVQTETTDGDPLGVVLVRDGKAIHLTTPHRAHAAGLAADGTVLGFGTTWAHGRRNFVWRNGKTTILPTTDGTQPPWGAAYGIAGGYAVGDEYVSTEGGGNDEHAVLWKLYEAKTSR